LAYTTVQNITPNVKKIRNLPLYIEQVKDIPAFHLRGEIVLPKNGFDRLNADQLKA